MIMNVGVYLFTDVELLDFAGPCEVFTTANRLASEGAPFNVFSVAAGAEPVRTRAGVTIQPDYTFATHPPLDLLLVPGGVVDEVIDDPAVRRWISDVSAAARLTASVCNGAFLLAAAGLLDGRRVTTHWEDVDALRTRFPNLNVEEGPRWVDQGDVVTSAGVSAGIDMSLHLVGRIHGEALAQATARQMDFQRTL
jgi:transcriptional regulator GlxA family with amidase domain